LLLHYNLFVPLQKGFFVALTQKNAKIEPNNLNVGVKNTKFGIPQRQRLHLERKTLGH